MPAKQRQFVRLVRRAFLLALLIITTLLFADYYILSRQLQNLQGNAAYVEISGQQRMLVQRMALLALGLTTTNNPDLQNQFQDEISKHLDRMMIAHHAIVEGSAEMNLPPSAAVSNLSGEIFDLYFSEEQELNNRLLTFFGAIENLIGAEPSDWNIDHPSLSEITLASTSLLEDLRITTEFYREKGENGILQLRRTKIFLLIGTLALLAAIALLVFLPLLRKLKNEFHKRERAEANLKKAARSLKVRSIELERSNNELEQFAGIVAHDLKAPLTNIQAFLDIISTSVGGDFQERFREPLEHIDQGLNRMRTMISDLLAYSKVTEGDRTLNQAVDLKQIITEITEDLTATIKEVEAEIVLKDLPVVQADPSQMRQLFQNLISNALKFGKPNETPKIEISGAIHNAKDNGCSALITVKDNGIGFDSKLHAERVFKIFRRFHSKEYEGSGVGLSICKRIVERYNGTINVDSSPGKGCRFRIELPLDDSGNLQRR